MTAVDPESGIVGGHRPPLQSVDEGLHVTSAQRRNPRGRAIRRHSDRQQPSTNGERQERKRRWHWRSGQPGLRRTRSHGRLLGICIQRICQRSRDRPRHPPCRDNRESELHGPRRACRSRQADELGRKVHDADRDRSFYRPFGTKTRFALSGRRADPEECQGDGFGRQCHRGPA